MKIKDKITQSLASITVELQEISPDFYVIGASAMILSGIEVGETADIDILTTEMNSCKLQHLLKTYMEIFIGNLIIKIPTIEEQKRILSLFGREKDLKRILILNHYLL